MPPPPTPSLSVTAPAIDSFLATVSAGSASAEHTLYWRAFDSDVTFSSDPITGNGNFPAVGSLTPLGHYLVWAVAYEGGSYSLPAITSVALVQPDTLTAAVHSHFSGSAPLASYVSGGLWTGEVPEGTGFPYGWLELSGVTPAPNFIDQAEYARISVHLYALGAASAERAASLFRSRFDYKKLTFSDASQVKCIAVAPSGYRLVCENLRHKTGQLVWRAVLNYQILLQRPR